MAITGAVAITGDNTLPLKTNEKNIPCSVDSMIRGKWLNLCNGPEFLRFFVVFVINLILYNLNLYNII